MTRRRKLTIEVVGDVKDGQNAIDNLGVTVDDVGGRFDGFADKAGAALAAGFAIDQGIQFVGMMNEAGLAAEITGQKASTVLGPALGDMQVWADDLNESLGVTDLQLLGMATNMADLLKPMGFTATEAANMSQEMLDLSGALSAWSGGQMTAQEVSETLASAMLGEREALKTLGISINQAEVDEKALAIARAAGRDEITQMDQALATQQLILAKSTDAQAAWANGSMDAIKNQNELKAVVAEGKEALAQLLFPAIGAVAGILVNDLIPAFQTTGEFIAENKEAFIAAGIAVTTLLVPAFVAWAVSAASAAAATLAAAAPVIAVGAAVAALTAGIIWAYENVDIFRAAVDAVATYITDYYIPALKAVASVFVDGWTAAWDLVQPILDVMGTQINALKDYMQGVVDFITGVFSGDWDQAWQGLKDMFSSVWDLITAPLDALPDTIGALPGKIAEKAVGMFDGIKTAFGSALNWIIEGWNGLRFSIDGWDAKTIDTPIGSQTIVPGWDGFSFGVPPIDPLDFHSGGVVRGNTPGGETLIVAQDGERISPAPSFGRVDAAGLGMLNLTIRIGEETFARQIELASLTRPLDIRIAE
ncbi:MAG: hypothetical protein AAF548_12935 [Actinomycetota bacterium]